MQLHATQRVAVDPCVVHLARFVACRIVRRGVQAQAIRDRLDERRALAITGPADGVADRRVDGEEVVAVALDAGKPVGDRLLRQSLGGGLLLDRGRDRPAVVLAQKDDRGLHHPCEVGRLVEVALRGAAVTENREHDAGVALHLQPPRETDRLGQLARDRGLKRQHVQACGHLERDRVADVPQEGEPKRVAVPQLTGELAILRHEPVRLLVQRHRGADGRGLLTDARRERHHAPLTLQADAALVEAPPPKHHAIAIERHLIAHRLVLQELAVLVEIPRHRRY